MTAEQRKPGLLAYLQTHRISESPNATEIQIPAGLANGFDLHILAARNAHIPAVLRSGAVVEELPAEIAAGSVVRSLRFAMAALGRLRKLRNGTRPLGFCTRFDMASLVAGGVISMLSRIPWVIFCTDHPYPIEAERDGLRSRVVGAIKRAILRFSFRRAAIVCFHYHPDAMQHLLRPGQRCSYLPNGTPFADIDPALAGVPAVPGLVGVISNVGPGKGIEVVVDALRILRQRLPGARLKLVGEIHRGFYSRLQEKLGEVGLSDAVRLTGWLPYRDALAAAAECAVCVYAYPPKPRYRWNYVLKIGEYFALGKPVVAVNTPGASFYVRDGVNGYLVEPESAAAMAEALRRILESDSIRESMSVEARETARRYAWPEIHKQLCANIEAALCGADGNR